MDNNKTSGYVLWDSPVVEGLNWFDSVAQENDIEYALGGGFALQSYLLEGFAERKNTEVNSLRKGETENHLRRSGDLDIPILEDETFYESITASLYQKNMQGDISKTEDGKYIGEVGLGDTVDLNIFSGEAKGFTQNQFQEQFTNKNRYSDKRVSFDRVGIENVAWMKARGAIKGKRQKDLLDLSYLMRFHDENIDYEYIEKELEASDEVNDLIENLRDESVRDDWIHKLTS